MPEQRIKDLESQLLTANETIAKLTAANAILTESVLVADVRNRKLRRSARNDESNFRDQLTIANNRKG